MSSVPFHYLDLRAFCYVTEEEKRVEEAVRTLLPEGFELQRTASEGHYGDRILVLSARVENADDLRTVLDRLEGFSEDDAERFLGELEERVDQNCSFFMTLDKQAAFRDEIRLGDGITVQGKVEAYPAKKERAIENLETFVDRIT